MNIKFTTNIDHYRTVSWPVLTDIVPRKGDYIFVHPGSEGYCESRKIPKRLEVVSVYWYYDRVVVELWYNETDYKLYTQSGHKLL